MYSLWADQLFVGDGGGGGATDLKQNKNTGSTRQEVGVRSAARTGFLLTKKVTELVMPTKTKT